MCPINGASTMQLSSLKSGQAGYSNQGNKVKIAQTQCFRDLIDSGSVYVDKTEQIFRLLNTERTFIAGPAVSARP